MASKTDERALDFGNLWLFLLYFVEQIKNTVEVINMKKVDKKILDEFQELKDLLYEAEEAVTTGVRGIPFPEYDHRATWLLNRDMRHKLFETHPECFIPLHKYGRAIPIFSVCNREGALDPFMVDFSLKLAKKMSGNINAPEEVKMAKVQLESIQRKLKGKLV